MKSHDSFGAEDGINVLDHLPIGVLYRDVKGRVTAYNRALAAQFPAHASESALGKTLDEIAGRPAQSADPHHEAMATGQSVVRMAVEERYAGNRANLLRTIVPIYNDDGVATGTATITEDRNELVALEQDLAQAQKLESVGQLAAGIAHEINTPMQYIGDNTHFLKNSVARLLAIAHAAEAATDASATADDREHLVALLAKSKLPMIAERAPKAADDALSGVESVSRIVTAMKRFSHPGGAEMAPVDLNDSIATTLTVCRNEWKYAAEVVTDFGELPLVEAHLGELNQVWLNMIVNAAHAVAERHADEQGTISVTTVHDALLDRAIVTISDDGAGISAANLERVLDPFFTTKEVGKGTGQGLTIAHQVISTGHQGTIEIDSVEGEGTTFKVAIPTTQPRTDLA